MKSSGTSEFWQLYRELPEPIKQSARRTYRLWDENPRAPALRFKKVRDVYSVRIGTTGCRAIAIDVPDLMNEITVHGVDLDDTEPSLACATCGYGKSVYNFLNAIIR